MRNLIVTLLAYLLAGAALAQAPSSFQPVGSMSALMIDIIYPTSDAIFYVDRDPPKNQHEWELLRASALTLAESGNLLMMDSRARDQGDWIKESRALVEAGAAAYKAAQAKDLDGIRALNDRLTQVCIDCHQEYRPGYHRRPPAP
jgi:cytochrome c556